MPIPNEPLESRIAKLEARLAALKGLQQHLTDLEQVIAITPEIQSEAVHALRALADRLSPTRPPLVGGVVRHRPVVQSTPEDESDPDVDEETATSCVQKIIAYFRDNENKPATIAILSRHTSAAVATVRQILYRRHKEKFVRIVEKGSSFVHWCLQPEVLRQGSEPDSLFKEQNRPEGG
jgi:uncharacterized coiled-coil protein SlyX